MGKRYKKGGTNGKQIVKKVAINSNKSQAILPTHWPKWDNLSFNKDNKNIGLKLIQYV